MDPQHEIIAHEFGPGSAEERERLSYRPVADSVLPGTSRALEMVQAVRVEECPVLERIEALLEVLVAEVQLLQRTIAAFVGG